MFTKSIWNSFAETTNFPTLSGKLKVDVAIIGGGITGLTTAYELSQKGKNVAVLEKSRVGKGTTSHSTGNLYSTVDKQLNSLLSKYDTSTISNLVEARSAAVDKIEEYIKQLNIECDFKRVPWYLFAGTEQQNHKIVKELEDSRDVLIPVKNASEDEIPFTSTKAIKTNDQAQFNPMLYVQGFAKKIEHGTCHIYENTHVHEVKEHGSYLEILTDNAVVEAEHVVHATHTPKGIKFVHTLLGPYREYGIACKVEKDAHPEGIFWGYFEGQDKYSTRTYTKNDETYLLVVGKPHKTGHADSNVKHIRELEEFARKHFTIKEVTHRWGGQHYRPADSLPYIGRDKEDSNIYIATGYSTDGLIYGTLAGMIISDLIIMNSNSWATIFDSTRNQPLKAAKKFLKENMDVAKEFLKYIPGTFADEDFAGIAPGEGKVLESDDGKIAVYKKEDGSLHACSAVCPHMACIVNWNNAEKTWDCPCHASRFSADGKLLEGPSLHDLKNIDLRG